MMFKLIVMCLFMIFMLFMLILSYKILDKKADSFTDEELEILQDVLFGELKNPDALVSFDTVNKTIGYFRLAKMHHYFFIAWHVFLIIGLLIIIFK